MQQKSCSLLAVAVMLVVWLALADAALLVYVSRSGAGGLCGAGSGCDQVVRGPYGTLHGVPLALAGLGLAAVMALLVVVVVALPSRARHGAQALWAISTVASLVSVYLQYVQAALIHARCPWCIAFACAMAMLFGLSGSLCLRLRAGETVELRGASVALLVGAPPIVGVVLFLGALGSPPPGRALLVVEGRTYTEDDWLRETPGAEAARHDLLELQEDWADQKVLTLALDAESRRRGVTIAAIESELASSGAHSGAHSADGVRGAPDDATASARRARIVALAALSPTLARLHVKRLFDPAFPVRVEFDVRGVVGQQGPESAPVTVVQASDFECPFCVRTGLYLEELRKRFGDRVRIVYWHNPLAEHHDALLAATAIECAGQLGRFWEYHRVLLANSPRLSLDDLVGYGSEIGLDRAVFRGMLESGQGRGEVLRQKAQLARHRITAVPMFFVNGKVLPGAIPFATLSSAVEEALETKSR